MAVRRAHHGNLDALIAQSSDTSGPFSFDRGPSFELEAELAKEIDRRPEPLDDDSCVVHPFERHPSNLHARRLLRFSAARCHTVCETEWKCGAQGDTMKVPY